MDKIKDINNQIDNQNYSDRDKQRMKLCVNLLVLSYPKKVTRPEVMEFCGIGNDRDARRIMSEVKKLLPVIATSDSTGYKLANVLIGPHNDLEDVIHTWKEIDSRIEELEAVKKPLIKFYEDAMQAMYDSVQEDHSDEAIWHQDYLDYKKDMGD